MTRLLKKRWEVILQQLIAGEIEVPEPLGTIDAFLRNQLARHTSADESLAFADAANSVVSRWRITTLVSPTHLREAEVCIALAETSLPQVARAKLTQLLEYNVAWDPGVIAAVDPKAAVLVRRALQVLCELYYIAPSATGNEQDRKPYVEFVLMLQRAARVTKLRVDVIEKLIELSELTPDTEWLRLLTKEEMRELVLRLLDPDRERGSAADMNRLYGCLAAAPDADVERRLFSVLEEVPTKYDLEDLAAASRGAPIDPSNALREFYKPESTEKLEQLVRETPDDDIWTRK